MRVKKINDLLLDTYSMVMTGFLLHNSLRKVQFFEETFMLVDINTKVVLEMLFFILSNVDFQFNIGKLTWRSYTTVKALPTISQIKLIDKRELPKAMLDQSLSTFVIQITALQATEEVDIAIHPS